MYEKLLVILWILVAPHWPCRFMEEPASQTDRQTRRDATDEWKTRNAALFACLHPAAALLLKQPLHKQVRCHLRGGPGQLHQVYFAPSLRLSQAWQEARRWLPLLLKPRLSFICTRTHLSHVFELWGQKKPQNKCVVIDSLWTNLTFAQQKQFIINNNNNKKQHIHI